MLTHVAVRRARLSEADEQVWQALSSTLRVPVRLLEPSWHEVFRLVRVQRLSAYDASYLQIALALRLPLTTLDAALADAAERLGVTLRH